MAQLKSLKVACVQMDAGSNEARNIAKAIRAFERPGRDIDWLAYPEVFHFRGDRKLVPYAAQRLNGPLVRVFQELARKKRKGILLGSVIEKTSEARRFYNTSVLISPDGRIAAVYRKMHLFDVNLKGKVKARESEMIRPGRRVVAVHQSGVTFGLTICYDLRFPEIFRRLTSKGSQVIFVPSNFTAYTGQAHWEVLLRARAIENQVFIVAPAQVGKNPATGVRSFGNSVVIDPWGRVLARGSGSREEMIVARLELRALTRLRREFPVLAHRRLP